MVTGYILYNNTIYINNEEWGIYIIIKSTKPLISPPPFINPYPYARNSPPPPLSMCVFFCIENIYKILAFKDYYEYIALLILQGPIQPLSPPCDL